MSNRLLRFINENMRCRSIAGVPGYLVPRGIEPPAGRPRQTGTPCGAAQTRTSTGGCGSEGASSGPTRTAQAWAVGLPRCTRGAVARVPPVAPPPLPCQPTRSTPPPVTRPSAAHPPAARPPVALPLRASRTVRSAGTRRVSPRRMPSSHSRSPAPKTARPGTFPPELEPHPNGRRRLLLDLLARRARPPRCRAVVEMQPRCRRDAAEMPPRDLSPITTSSREVAPC